MCVAELCRQSNLVKVWIVGAIQSAFDSPCSSSTFEPLEELVHDPSEPLALFVVVVTFLNIDDASCRGGRNL